jgi:hypothetical protein
MARDLVAELANRKGVKPSAFPGLDASLPIEDAAEEWLIRSPIEVWGTAILTVGGRAWADLTDEKRGVVEAVTVRNLYAHGMPVFSQRAVNRLAAASTTQKVPSVGDKLVLDQAAFVRHVANLRSFGRLMADGVTNLPNVA